MIIKYKPEKLIFNKINLSIIEKLSARQQKLKPGGKRIGKGLTFWGDWTIISPNI